MVKQLSQMQRIMSMPNSFRFRLGAVCALKPGTIQHPNGERKAIKQDCWEHVENVPRFNVNAGDYAGATFIGYTYADKFWPVSGKA